MIHSTQAIRMKTWDKNVISFFINVLSLLHTNTPTYSPSRSPKVFVYMCVTLERAITQNSLQGCYAQFLHLCFHLCSCNLHLFQSTYLSDHLQCCSTSRHPVILCSRNDCVRSEDCKANDTGKWQLKWHVVISEHQKHDMRKTFWKLGHSITLLHQSSK